MSAKWIIQDENTQCFIELWTFQGTGINPEGPPGKKWNLFSSFSSHGLHSISQQIKNTAVQSC